MTVSDEELVRARDKDELVRRYYDDVYRLARHLVQGRLDPSDVAQETFARALARLDSYRYDGSFRLWLFSIAANHVRDLFRRKKVLQLEDGYEEALPKDFAPDHKLLHQERSERVRDALANLPFDLQTVVTLQFRHQLGYPEISAVLGISVNAVRIRLYRALVALRQELA